MSEALISEKLPLVSHKSTPRTQESVYVASAAEAVQNWHQNRANRWYKDGADPNDLTGDYAFQRLRHEWFTPKIDPTFTFRIEDKFYAIGSCFARGLEWALAKRKLPVESAAPESASLKAAGKGSS